MSVPPLRVAVALVAATGWLLAVERGVAAWQGLADVPLSWPARFALTGLLLGFVATAAVGIAIVRALEGSARRRAGTIAAATVGAAAFGATGYALIGGAWISQQPWAPAIPAAMAAGGAVGLALAVVLARRRGWGRTLLFVEASIAANLADALVTPGLYPAFHLLMWGVAAVAITVAALRLAAAARRTPPGWWWLGIGPLGVLAIVGWVKMPSDVRAELVLRSPLAREVLRAVSPTTTSRLHAELASLSAHPSPPPPDADAPPLVADDVNVVFITVDALRADALPPERTGDRTFAAAGDTPRIDALLAESTQFRVAYAPASFTMRSLPAVFASRPPFEDHEDSAGALAEVMAELDRLPLAVAARYFIEEPEGRSILEGFSAVEVHPRSRQGEGVEQLLQLIDSAGDRPYFAWMHLMATHEPGFDRHLLSRRDGDWPTRYRRSLRWVDGEIGRVLDGLAERGQLQRTIVVFASDHGEGLGDNGINVHGETVFEEEVRVPLAFRLPGRPAALVSATVGLVDVVPTLVELLGGTPRRRHVGHSLVPLLRDPSFPWSRDYLTMSRRDTYAIVRDRAKLMYDASVDVFVRFDLVDDPTEDVDRFGEDPTVDAALRSAFVRADPALFAAELAAEPTRALLRQRLREVDPAAPDDTLPFLLQLVAAADDPDATEAALALFETGSTTTKLELVQWLLPTTPAVGELAGAHLDAIAGTAEELTFVDALAERRVGAFAPAQVFARMRARAAQASDGALDPYLRLVASWDDLPVATAGAAIAAGVDSGRPATTRLALTAAAALDGADATLAAGAVAHLADPEETTRMAACEALAAVGDPTALEPLRTALNRDGEDIRVRQACLTAAVEAVGEPAVDLVIEQAKDRMIAFYALRLLAKLRSPAALPYLREVAEHERSGRIKAAATQALRLTERANR